MSLIQGLYYAILERKDTKNAAGTLYHPDGSQKPWKISLVSLIEQFIPPELCLSPMKDDKIIEYAVDPTYLKSSVTSNNLYFLQYYVIYTKGRRGTIEEIIPASIAICKNNDKDKEIYIDVICSKKKTKEMISHSAGRLIEAVISFAKNKDYESVNLSALPPVLKYYAKWQFEHIKSCKEKESDAIKTMRGKITSTPSSLAESYEDDKLLEYMRHLHDEGFASKKKGECGKKILNKEKLKSNRCGDDGFKMKKCLHLTNL
jgi:hypothetical protein